MSKGVKRFDAIGVSDPNHGRKQMRLGHILGALGVATLLASAAPVAAQAKDHGMMHHRMHHMMMRHNTHGMMMRHRMMHHGMMHHRMMRHHMKTM
jgi:hypothetical protein